MEGHPSSYLCNGCVGVINDEILIYTCPTMLKFSLVLKLALLTISTESPELDH